MKKTARELWAEHGRLLLAVVGFFVVMAGLTRACAYACSDGLPASATRPPAQLVPRAPVAPVAPAALLDEKTTTRKDPLVTPEPSEAQRVREMALLADKPKLAPLPAKTDELALRQEDLKKRAKAEADIDKAIALYTQAVDTDPYAAGAREALLDRARLYMANGQLDESEADLFRLKRRTDVDIVKGDVQNMLDDIAKARKAASEPVAPSEP